MRKISAILAAMFLAGPAHAQVAGFEVHDAAGQRLGTLTQVTGQSLGNNSSGASIIFLTSAIPGSGYFALATGIARNGFPTAPQADANEVIPLYYLAANCTGTAYMSSDAVPAYAYAMSVNGGEVPSATIWAPGPPYQNLTALSVYGGAGLGTPATCSNINSPGQYGVPTSFSWTITPNLGLTALQ